MPQCWLCKASRVISYLTDKTIVFSFDRNGYLLHRLSFEKDDLDVTLENQTAVITGANSGMGYEACRFFAEKGATVHMLCRNESRGKQALEKLQAENENARLVLHGSSLFSVGNAWLCIGFADRGPVPAPLGFIALKSKPGCCNKG